jgi:hypothetical protein
MRVRYEDGPLEGQADEWPDEESKVGRIRVVDALEDEQGLVLRAVASSPPGYKYTPRRLRYQLVARGRAAFEGEESRGAGD